MSSDRARELRTKFNGAWVASKLGSGAPPRLYDDPMQLACERIVELEIEADKFRAHIRKLEVNKFRAFIGADTKEPEYKSCADPDCPACAVGRRVFNAEHADEAAAENEARETESLAHRIERLEGTYERMQSMHATHTARLAEHDTRIARAFSSIDLVRSRTSGP